MEKNPIKIMKMNKENEMDILPRLIGLSILFDNLSFKIPVQIKQTILDATNEIIILRNIHENEFEIKEDE